MRTTIPDAGPERDILIAFMMGCTIDAQVKCATRCGCADNAHGRGIRREQQMDHYLKSYSTDNACAHEVIEWLSDKGWHLEVYWHPERQAEAIGMTEKTCSVYLFHRGLIKSKDVTHCERISFADAVTAVALEGNV